jgi:hypothetical protein
MISSTATTLLCCCSTCLPALCRCCCFDCPHPSLQDNLYYYQAAMLWLLCLLLQIQLRELFINRLVPQM